MPGQDPKSALTVRTSDDLSKFGMQSGRVSGDVEAVTEDRGQFMAGRKRNDPMLFDLSGHAALQF